MDDRWRLVAFSVSWDASNISVHGSPNRAAITDVMLRVTDDAAGLPVRLHANGIGLVGTPPEKYPNGVITFNFDDDWATMVDPGSTILATHSFPATAYVIVDKLGTQDRATVDDLHRLDGTGWDIAAHAFTDADHSAMFTTLSPVAVETDMVSSREWLIEQGFGGYDHCAYPSGEFDEIGQTNVLPIAAKYFTSCRHHLWQAARGLPAVGSAQASRVLRVGQRDSRIGDGSGRRGEGQRRLADHRQPSARRHPRRQHRLADHQLHRARRLCRAERDAGRHRQRRARHRAARSTRDVVLVPMPLGRGVHVPRPLHVRNSNT